MMIKLIIRKIMTEELAQSIRCLLQAWGPEIRFGTKINTGHTSVTTALGRGSRDRLLPRANRPTSQRALCSSIVGSNRERGLRAGIVTHTCSPAQEAEAQKSRSLGVWASLVYTESTTLQRETLCLKKSGKENDRRKEGIQYLSLPYTPSAWTPKLTHAHIQIKQDTMMDQNRNSCQTW